MYLFPVGYVLSQEEENVYALLKLSNVDTQNLTVAEFRAITGEEPRRPVRPPKVPAAK